MGRPWVGVDLDGTLAVYDKWRGVDHIGDPIPRMVRRVQRHLAKGDEVRIVTARVSPKTEDDRDIEYTRAVIVNWCIQHIGVALKVTHEKDHGMMVIYDDRAIQVEKNTGRLIGVVDPEDEDG